VGSTAIATCPLCEATCGIAVDVEGGKIVGVRGDPEDPLSHGYVCPKAMALVDLHDDPDRIRAPMRRRGDRWEEIGWDEALDEAGRRLAEIQDRHGRSAVAVYIGNPTVHSYAALLAGPVLLAALGTRNFMSANSVDALPRLLASYWLYGGQAILPVPDLERTDHLLVLGANPVVSNGSVMTAPGMRRRIADIRARGGRVIVIDPRRTETAALADTHHFIRPGTDALLLGAMVQVILAEGLARPGRLATMTDGLDRLVDLAAPFRPERVAPVVGISAAVIRELAVTFARARSAACYGRVGTCVQEHGTVTSWWIDVLHVVTGNLDRPGGAMFTTPAVDLPALVAALRLPPFGRTRSRVRGLPALAGELPAICLAEEIETPGPGQVRALVTHAGNPVRSLPNGRRVDRALASLDFMVSVDPYLNETTRHAHLLLPPSIALEHDHYPLVFHTLAVRNTAKYAPAVLAPPAGVRDGWRIVAGLAERLLAHRGLAGRAAAAALGVAARRRTPRDLLALGLRLGPQRRVVRSLAALEERPHGIDLGPLEPRLPGILRTPGRRIRLAPDEMVAELRRLEARLAAETTNGARGADGELLLINRRDLRSNNSWMHNLRRLVKGGHRCTVLLHPTDAARRGIRDGQRVRITSRVGAIELDAELTTDVMPGVACIPHGWGHDLPGVRQRIASTLGGASVNDLTDDTLLDPVSGGGVLTGFPIRIATAPPPAK